MAFQQYPQKGGIPSGVTAARPSSPATGDTFYDGTLGFLLIWEGTQWIPCSAPAAQPSITVADVGTNIAYGTVSASVTFTEGVTGGKAAGFTAIQGSTTQTSTSNPVVINVTGTPGSYAFTGTAFNGFGTSPVSPSASQTLTSLPQAPTIGTATTSIVTSNITVTWTLNATGGKNLSAITITPYLNGTTAGTSQTAATTSSTTHVFTGLTSGSAYTFKVKTTNANGVGLESSASNSVTVPTFVTPSYLIVAGGGGNTVGQGGNREAGSGAGGMRTGSATLAKGATYTITVGAGGTGQANGVNSSITATGFTTISCTGGGKGGNNDSAPAGNGGNGGSGGGAWYLNAAGTGVSGEGNAGGIGYATDPYGGAGGGAGSAGGRDTSAGAGLASSITGTSVTYAAGGVSNGYPSTVRDANGAANTGNGASGVGNGGSGVVIISTTTSAVSTTGSPTVTTNGSNTVYKFTGDGTITYQEI